ncbi:MAG TPA: glycosyl hydrolase [Candidatus Limnocylindrales bacterium]|nr:glycosyl hydrolase [Candidatus Limnocylindrales bacterium]
MRTNQSLLPVLASVLFVLAGHARPADSLESGFLNPPDSARPQTWWHWMNGNITPAGITADLEAMKQIGLGGATIVNVDCGIPRGPVTFMSPEWRADFKFAVQEANRVGLKLCVENCAGWSSSGGPWITPEHAMQHVVSSEVAVTGPTNFTAALPLPPTRLDFYRDIAVLAFPTPAGGEKIQDLEAKDGDNGGFVMSSPATPNALGSVIRREAMVDLTSRLQAGGRLEWDVPKGRWTILRVGYTPTGVNNHPAPREGEGLECDKLSQAALDAHWAGFMQKILNDLGPLAGETLDSSLIDSYEVGGQNWTENFREEFRKRRGYDPLKFLPAFTGRVVDHPEVSERFLWDVRRTIADLFAENYYGHFDELCRQHGLMSAVEPYTGPFESLQCGAPLHVVMGEFWSGSQGDPSVKLAASVAHIYGKTIVGAESFTASPEHGRWQNDPFSLKTLGDLMFCQGVNRYTFHRYAMQPWTNRWPGMTMGPWGIHFERTETWWSQGKPWIDYITRCQFLLQQGRAVADAAYFDGQSAPVEMRANNPALPAGYDYDAVDADVLLHGATVKDGRLTLASGANYAVLILPPDDINMTPQMLECLRKLVRAGATVVGPRPRHSPSLQGYPPCDAQVKKAADELWGECNGGTVQENVCGQGRIVWGKSLAEVLASQSLKPDFEFQGASAATHLAYTHRIAGASDIYFVSNQRWRFDSAECTFRVSGKVPELWHPDTGVIEPAPVWSASAGRTTVRLDFDPAGSVFVIFRHPADGADHLVAVKRNGPEVATTKPVELRIIKAVYRPVPSRNDRRLDVTARVKALVAGGTRRIPADNEMAGEDPAVNIVKRLRVEFSLNGGQQTAEVQEGETLEIPAGAEIVQALYGDLRAETASADQTVDVTRKLADLAKHEELEVSVNNELAGRDPAFGIPKELRVDYTLDGKPGQETVREGDTLTLPATLSIGQAPAWETSVAADGSPVVTAWSNGRVTLRTADGKVLSAIASDVPAPQTVTGPWKLNLPPDWGAPPSVTLEQLISWTDHTNDGLRYFSGTATYEKGIEIPADRLSPDRELWLDLGAVKNFAEVSLNGQDLGVLWKPPFRVNITRAATPGVNELVVKVTNLWPNRLIGDEQLPPDCEWNGQQLKEWPQWLLDGRPSPTGRLTFTTWHHYTKDSPLLESGLLGPVTLRTTERILVN